VKIWLQIALNVVRLPKFEPVNGKSWSPRKMMVKDLRQRSWLAWFCARADSCVVFNTGQYTVLPDNSIYLYRSAEKVIQWIGKSGSGFQICGKNLPLRIGHVIRRMHSGCNRIVDGIICEMSELITQERIAIGSSNLVEGLTTWPAMYDHWPRLKCQRSRSQGHVTYQQQ